MGKEKFDPRTRGQVEFAWNLLGRATRFTRAIRSSCNEKRKRRTNSGTVFMVIFQFRALTILRSLSIYGLRYRGTMRPSKRHVGSCFVSYQSHFEKLSLSWTRNIRARVALVSRNLFSNNVITFFVKLCQTLAESKNIDTTIHYVAARTYQRWYISIASASVASIDSPFRTSRREASFLESLNRLGQWARHEEGLNEENRWKLCSAVAWPLISTSKSSLPPPFGWAIREWQR